MSGQQVFISYQRADEGFARQVRERLVAYGVKTWMDQYDIPVGAYWPDEIDKGLAASEIVVGVLSPDSVESRNVKNEWDWAIQNDKRLLLLQVKPCVVPHRYVSINFIDATGADIEPALLTLLVTLGVDVHASAEITIPEVQYARSGDVSIAYQVIGDGPIDLVYMPGFISNLEYIWEEPSYDRYLLRLTSFARLIVLDKRGTGLSDRVTESATVDQRMDDIRAVMDAAGSERAVIMGCSEGAPISALFAATYPQRTTALILYGSYASGVRSEDYPFGRTPEENEVQLNKVIERWGKEDPELPGAPSLAGDRRFQAWFARYKRLSMSPSAALALEKMNIDLDVRQVLPTIHIPTLVLHVTGDRLCHIEEGRYVAFHIPGARFVEFPGTDHIPTTREHQDAILNEIEAFLTGTRQPAPEPDRILVTVLCLTDSGADDRQRSESMAGIRELASHEVARHRGQPAASSDGAILATFDGPTRAIPMTMSVSMR